MTVGEDPNRRRRSRGNGSRDGFSKCDCTEIFRDSAPENHGTEPSEDLAKNDPDLTKDAKC